MMNEQKPVFLDYRSPYVWQSRTINFNKQIIKKLNHNQKCKSKQQQRNKKFGLLQQRNNGLNHLLEVSPTNSSLSPSLSSAFDEKDDTPIVKNTFVNSKKYQNAKGSKMTRSHQEIYSSPRVSSVYTHHPYFANSGSRCPVHGSSHLPQPYKYSTSNQFDGPIYNRFSSMNDLQDYNLQANHYFSYPYYYQDNNYVAHYPHGYYSSQMYLPGSYIPSLQYMSHPNLAQSIYSSKMLRPHSYPHRNASHDYKNQIRLLHDKKQTKSRCKGHLIVMAIILTVITIGVIMGLVLAVTIN